VSIPLPPSRKKREMQHSSSGKSLRKSQSAVAVHIGSSRGGAAAQEEGGGSGAGDKHW
jgi:hypothetical protein